MIISGQQARERNLRVDRVIRIPASGHLTRRLVNVAMDVVITEIDCGTQKALQKFSSESGSLVLKISGRTAAENIVHPITQEILVNAGSLITQQTSALIENVNIKGSQSTFHLDLPIGTRGMCKMLWH